MLAFDSLNYSKLDTSYLNYASVFFFFDKFHY